MSGIVKIDRSKNSVLRSGARQISTENHVPYKHEVLSLKNLNACCATFYEATAPLLDASKTLLLSLISDAINKSSLNSYVKDQLIASVEHVVENAIVLSARQIEKGKGTKGMLMKAATIVESEMALKAHVVELRHLSEHNNEFDELDEIHEPIISVIGDVEDIVVHV